MQVFLDGDRAGHTWANLTVDHIDAHFTQLTGSRLAVGDITDAINGVRLAPVTDTGGNVITPDQWFSTGVLTLDAAHLVESALRPCDKRISHYWPAGSTVSTAITAPKAK